MKALGALQIESPSDALLSAMGATKLLHTVLNVMFHALNMRSTPSARSSKGHTDLSTV